MLFGVHAALSVTALCQVQRRGSRTSPRGVQEQCKRQQTRIATEEDSVQCKEKNILKARAVKYWERLPKEVVKSLSLAIFKT